ncbi:hypothetical protein G3O08_01390 [Cryomorpha ignava]|uniref:Uncharacterized protein n=1 Tax=Cryomorpha ignava TaxID=101383 RepID=A0A7K3WN78_9FLAO|nr:hypothetical protein [Cryomorpha ignava]NEN22155.1 hypothetical protein [Cryomorpha ignava]
MKTIKYIIIAIFVFLVSLSFGQTPICTDFNNGSLDGWQNYNTTSIITSGGPNGSNFLELHDPQGPGGFDDAWGYNSTSYPQYWSEQFIGQCLCFDYNVLFDNHFAYTAQVPLNIMIYDGTDPQSSSLRATFISNIITTDYDGWEHVCAPIEFSIGDSLPGNSDGHWTGVSAADWNTLLNNVGGIAFTTNIYYLDVNSLYPIDLGVDNICIVDCSIDETPSDSAAYCCPGDNFVTNGNFEDLLNPGFTSSYGNTPLAPGNYTIGTSATAQTYFNTTVTDHSYCENSSLFSLNQHFMLVNGRTQQANNAVIWEQTISGLDTNSTYMFCANFKNMNQCTFDTLLRVNMQVASIGSSGFSAISAPNTPCSWVDKQFHFTTGNNTSYTLRIILEQTVNGDGNDLAIDDIAVIKLADPELSISVEHQGNPHQIVASINTMSTSPSDDVLHGTDCAYYWFVAEVGSYPPVSLVNNTFAYGNGSGNTFGGNISTIPWNLTTDFNPDYIFAQNKLYIIGMYTPVCECYDEGFTFQLTLNNRSDEDEVMTEELKQQIIDWILNGYNSNGVSLDPTQQLNDGSE